MPEQITIPGDPGALQALVAQIRAAGADVDSVQGRVATNGLETNWSGQAAQAFHASQRELPGELANIVAAFSDASQALAAFASTLTELQQRADWYNAQLAESEQHLREAHARKAAAETKVRAAQLAHSAATDPLSLSTATRAMDFGESALRQAVADIEDVGGRIGQLASGGEGLLSEYADAVRACCGTLDALRASGSHAFAAWLSNHVSEIVGRIDHTLALWWRGGGKDEFEHAEELADLGGFLHDGIGTIGFIVEHGSLSHLQSIASFTDGKAFKGAGYVLGIISLAQYQRVAWDDSRGEDSAGRAFTMGFSGVSDALFMIPGPVGDVTSAANFLDGGALRADLGAFGAVTGSGISDGIRGWESAYNDDVRDRQSHNYLGLALHTVDGGAAGVEHGVSTGFDRWGQDVSEGKYGGFVQHLSNAEDFVIEHPRAVVDALFRGL